MTKHRRAPLKYHRIYAESTWFPNSRVQTISRHLHVPASRMERPLQWWRGRKSIHFAYVCRTRPDQSGQGKDAQADECEKEYGRSWNRGTQRELTDQQC